MLLSEITPFNKFGSDCSKSFIMLGSEFNYCDWEGHIARTQRGFVDTRTGNIEVGWREVFRSKEGEILKAVTRVHTVVSPNQEVELL